MRINPNQNFSNTEAEAVISQESVIQDHNSGNKILIVKGPKKFERVCLQTEKAHGSFLESKEAGFLRNFANLQEKNNKFQPISPNSSITDRFEKSAVHKDIELIQRRGDKSVENNRFLEIVKTVAFKPTTKASSTPKTTLKNIKSFIQKIHRKISTPMRSFSISWRQRIESNLYIL